MLCHDPWQCGGGYKQEAVGKQDGGSHARLKSLCTRDEGGMGNRDPRTWSVVYAEPAAGGNLTTAALERPILFEV